MAKAMLMACLALVLAAPAFAQGKDMPMDERMKGHGHGVEMCNIDRPGDGMGEMMSSCLEHADKLGLSEEQINKIKPIHREMQKKRARFTADLKIAQIEMKEIMEVKDFDLEKATAAVRKIGDIKTSHRVEMLALMKQVHAILTDEQFRKMKKMHMRMEGHKPGNRMMKK